MQTIDTVNLYSHTRATVTNIQLLSNPGLGSGISLGSVKLMASKRFLRHKETLTERAPFLLSSGFELTRKVKDLLFVYELIQSLK